VAAHKKYLEAVRGHTPSLLPGLSRGGTPGGQGALRPHILCSADRCVEAAALALPRLSRSRAGDERRGPRSSDGRSRPALRCGPEGAVRFRARGPTVCNRAEPEGPPRAGRGRGCGRRPPGSAPAAPPAPNRGEPRGAAPTDGRGEESPSRRRAPGAAARRFVSLRERRGRPRGARTVTRLRGPAAPGRPRGGGGAAPAAGGCRRRARV